jgi:hypothetical protein
MSTINQLSFFSNWHFISFSSTTSLQHPNWVPTGQLLLIECTGEPWGIAASRIAIEFLLKLLQQVKPLRQVRMF